MATASQQILSGSTDGDPIKVVGTTIGAATTIHAAPTGTTTIDRVKLYASNTHTAPVAVSVAWGGVTDPDHLVVDAWVIPPNTGPIELTPYLPIRNSNVISAFAATANVINIVGDVIRVS